MKGRFAGYTKIAIQDTKDVDKLQEIVKELGWSVQRLSRASRGLGDRILSSPEAVFDWEELIHKGVDEITRKVGNEPKG